ncbi:hypothetical protein CRUP_036278, partial [Coryphaenoides rupestris]
MDEEIIFRMSAFSDRGGRKYMEDVFQVKIECEEEPTLSRSGEEPAVRRHDSEEEEEEEGEEEGGGGKPTTRTTIATSGESEKKPAGTTTTTTTTAAAAAAAAAAHTTTTTTVNSRRSVAFFAVFDGHGGQEAAHFARDHLWDILKAQKGFWSRDHDEVCAALRKGFVACHYAMWKKL